MQSILCPTDFSPVAQNALLYAIDFAKQSQASIVLFHSEFFPSLDEEFGGDESKKYPEERLVEVKEKFDSLIDQLKFNEPGVKYKYVLEQGLAAENIAEYANNHNIDLIIMGSSGSSGLESIFEGSTAVSVVKKANCPVLIIPENLEYRCPKVFVYATDALDDEDTVIDKILKITSEFDAQLELIHIKSEDSLELIKSEEAIADIVNKHKGDNLQYKIIEGKSSVETIENYAKISADILVMAERKKNFIERLFSKNRVSTIANHAEIPLLVIHKE